LFESAAGKRNTSKRITAGDLTGIYTADISGSLEVRLMEDGPGVELELPDLRVLYFPIRNGLVFNGPAGKIVFNVVGGRVVGLTLAEKSIVAKKNR
jgi:hypothetical protein